MISSSDMMIFFRDQSQANLKFIVKVMIKGIRENLYIKIVLHIAITCLISRKRKKKQLKKKLIETLLNFLKKEK